MPIHNEWLLDCVVRYNFDTVSEVLRHLVYLANSEPKPIKKLIFKTIRCLHCHVGARADQHRKVDLGTPKEDAKSSNSNSSNSNHSSATTIAVHTFHYEWLCRITESCKIASVEKCVRIIIDYYQSRVKQAFHADGPEAAAAKELLLFGKNRHDDPRYAAVLLELQRRQQQDNDINDSATTEPAAIAIAPASAPVDYDDPAACSAVEQAEAIRRCQVGRNSASYAVARKETPAETEARRSKEILVENSEATKRAREQIRLALGSPMG